MVTKFTDRKDKPEYSLRRIYELAEGKQFEYVGNCERDVANLSYSREDVAACLLSLTPSHYTHSERYSEKGSWRDVYVTRHPRPMTDGDDEKRWDDLYIKLRLDSDCIVIYLHSFHQPRTI